MSSRAGRGPVRSYRRRKAVLDIDLNHVPSGDNREQEGPSTVLMPQQIQVIQQPQDVQEPPTLLGTGQVHALQQPPAVQPPTIDVEAFDDDDVIESSPRAFAEAKNKNSSRRNRRRTIVDVDLDDQARVTDNNSNKRCRVSLGQPIINCDLYINLEGCSSLERENMQPPEPPKEPVFNCPICIGPLVEEVSTKCGHIFCKACIKTAISAQNKCPTCRKKITVRSLIRVFLPSTS